MKVIRFELEGLVNSYRIPFFRTYHKSFLSPPKTTIVGMLYNISLKSQKDFFEILDEELIEVSVVINDIKGRAKDLWSYKTLKAGNMGKNVVRRDKLFMSNYTIYLNIKDEVLYDEILINLQKPKNMPSLGMDDELVFIKDIKEVILEENFSNRINSIFLNKENIKYKAFVKDISKKIELPTSNTIPTKFKAFDNKNKRVSKESIKDYEFNQVEFINCEIQFEEDIEIFNDKEKGNTLVFY